MNENEIRMKLLSFLSGVYGCLEELEIEESDVIEGGLEVVDKFKDEFVIYWNHKENHISTIKK